MSLVYNEYYNERTGLTVGVTKKLFSEQSPYQLVEVYETDTWGNLMTIDGMVMLSERDEFVYHEMIAHIPLFSHPEPKRVLIIGGGDGGTAREVLRHSTVEHVDLVEIDETVVRASKQYLPAVGDFDNPKLNVIHEDGTVFVKNVTEAYDVIIVDGSDPVGPAEGLFGKAFFKDCYEALNNNGILTAQSESPFVEHYHPSIRKIIGALDSIFDITKLYLAFIPLYPTGMWSIAFASKGIDPLSFDVLKQIDDRIPEFGTLKYYNREIHSGAFALPEFVKKIIRK